MYGLAHLLGGDERHDWCQRNGFEPGFEEKIFEQFFRAHDSLANAAQGSGLGLTLARDFAMAHKGEVLFRRREGGGSCFILRLPRAAAERSLGYRYLGTTRTLDQVIVQLRRKLGDNADAPRHLLTVHGVGYKLVL